MLELVTDAETRGFVQNILAFFVCGAALIWGGTPERIIAATWIVLFEFAGWLFRSLSGDSFQLLSVDFVSASTDFIAGVIWIGVALYANRNYPLWIAGMQVLAMTAHLARGVSDLISPIAYASMFLVPGWLQLIILAIGLTRHIRRKRKYGPYRDWRIVRGKPSIKLPAIDAEVPRQALKLDPATWRDEHK